MKKTLLILLFLTLLKSQAKSEPRTPLTIEVRNAAGVTRLSKSAPDKVELTSTQPYQLGDAIRITTLSWKSFLVIQADEKVPESLIYAPSGQIDFPIPFGKLTEGYDPQAFHGTHHITARLATPEEIVSYSNLALNPLDQRNCSEYFPHAIASSVTRDDPQFFERNAIDGNTHTTGHGKWPYESWGNGLNQDPWIKVDFGRPVTINKVRLFIRSDITPDKNHGGRPHDTYWTSALLHFSDGSSHEIVLKQSPNAQEFSFSEKKTSWLQIDHFKQPNQELGFAAITEIEAYGHEENKELPVGK